MGGDAARLCVRAESADSAASMYALFRSPSSPANRRGDVSHGTVTRWRGAKNSQAEQRERRSNNNSACRPETRLRPLRRRKRRFGLPHRGRNMFARAQHRRLQMRSGGAGPPPHLPSVLRCPGAGRSRQRRAVTCGGWRPRPAKAAVSRACAPQPRRASVPEPPAPAPSAGCRPACTCGRR
jgi:hypothetical protein